MPLGPQPEAESSRLSISLCSYSLDKHLVEGDSITPTRDNLHDLADFIEAGDALVRNADRRTMAVPRRLTRIRGCPNPRERLVKPFSP